LHTILKASHKGGFFYSPLPSITSLIIKLAAYLPKNKSTLKNNAFKQIAPLFITCLLTLSLNAQVKPKDILPYQRKCTADEYEALLAQKYPSRATKQQFEEWIAPKAAALKREHLQKTGLGTNDILTIPVVVHVLHKGDPVGTNENITAAQIQSQLTVMTQDFRKMLGTPGYNDNPVGADFEMEFCLAATDPNGMFTTGIMRYDLHNGGVMDINTIEGIKAMTQWDPEQYLNIWVTSNIYIGYFSTGYAQFPEDSGLDGLFGNQVADTDGIVLDYMCFGTKDLYPEGVYYDNIDKGHNTSHELGHFFGLRHIWGDGLDCTSDDYCDDTPITYQSNYGCPENLDSCEDSPGNDMIENYMDYTGDSCRSTFTLDQKFRAMAVMLNSPRRASLAASPVCAPGIVYANDGALQILTVNKPLCTINRFIPKLILTNAGSVPLTEAVINYSVDGGTAEAYTWTGSLAFNEETQIDLPLMYANDGSHEFSATIISVNGANDTAALNNTRSREFTLDAQPDFDTENITITLQPDQYGTETYFQLFDSAGGVIAGAGPFENSEDDELPPVFTQTVAVNSNECYLFKIYDAVGDGICCEYGDGYYSLVTDDGTVVAQGGSFGVDESHRFSINIVMGNEQFAMANAVKLYPNPSNSLLNIAMTDAGMVPDTYTVYNSLGQVMDAGNITAPVQTLTIANYANGVYFIKLARGDNATTLQFIKY
jgi:hypothetical protein